MSQPSNQYFSLPRFSRLFGRHTAEQLPSYAMAAAVVAGLLLLVLGVMAYSNGGTIGVQAQAGCYVVFMTMAAIIFTSNIFGQFGEKRQATVALLLPASHLEKFLVGWLYSLPIFLLLFTGVYYLVDAAVLYAGVQPGQAPELLNIFASRKAVQWVLFTVAMLHGVWLWGAIYFEKTHFIKTAFAVFLLVAVLSALNFQALRMLISPGVKAVALFANPMVLEGDRGYVLRVPDGQLPWLDLLPLALAGILWGAAYFRLTEKQL